MALMDTLNKIRNRKPTAQPTAMGAELGQQARERQVGARQSTGPAASSLGEQRQVAMGQTQQQQQQTSANIQADTIQRGADQQAQALGTQRAQQQQQFTEAMKNLTGQQQVGALQRQSSGEESQARLESQGRMTTDQIMNNFDNALNKLETDTGLRRDQMFNAFQKSNKELEDRQDAAELEQVAFLHSMQDKAYLEEIGRISRQRQLEDDVSFQREVMETIFGNDFTRALNTAKFTIDMSKEDAEFYKDLKAIDLDTARAIVNAEAKSQATKSIIEGTTSAIKAGVDYWGDDD